MTRALQTLASAMLITGLSLATRAHAQAPAAPPSTAATQPAATKSAPAAPAAAAVAPAAPTAPSSASPGPAGEGAPAPQGGCFPACRDGYICYVNQCISACNPPCARDERCTSAGQCERDSQLPPPPPPPSEPPPGAGTEAAPPPPAGEKSGYRRHDGFMLRLAAGLGGSGVHYDSPITSDLGGDWDSDSDWGGAGFFSFDIGASPIENFVLHFRMSHYGVVLDDSLGGWDYAALSMWGAGGTWYFMPINLYLTASLGIATGHLMAIDENADELDSDDVDVTDGFGGFGCGIDVGKEWWVGGSWGIGVAGRIHYLAFDNLSSAGIGVLFSATYQ